MKKLEEIKKRIDQIILLADQTLSTKRTVDYYTYVDSALFYQFRSASLSFIKNVYSESHPYFTEFHEKSKEETPTHVQYGMGILRSIKDEIDGGWIFSVKGLISAEIFSDFIEMAEYLLTEGYKDPAAVMLGSVLEEHLRQLCCKNHIDIDVIKDGKPMNKKAEALNSELASNQVYDKLDQKSVTSWLDLRNKAAHGKYSEYTKDQVSIMMMGVTNFISRTT